MEKKYRLIAAPTFFLNAVGDDNFSLALGSAGAKTEQLKQALRILGSNIVEMNFGTQTRDALIANGYPPAINDEATFNSIILRAYAANKKLITLTVPELRALYEQDVPEAKRSDLTFDKWMKREKLKVQVVSGFGSGVNVLLGWLKSKYAGVGNTSGAGAPNQPAPTNTGFFSKTADGSVPTGYLYIGGAVLLGLGIWGASALIKHSRALKQQ